MKIKLLTPLLCAFAMQAAGQTAHGLKATIWFQYNRTLNDPTLGNNHWSVGTGLGCSWFNKTMFRPVIDLTFDWYPLDNKSYLQEAQQSIPTVRHMTNALAGLSFAPARLIYFSLVMGPSYTGKQTLFGIKPSLGFYFSNRQRLTFKFSWLRVFHRTENSEFTGESFALGIPFL
ncbi:MAG TPA: hypothetical protein VKR32_16775 [Puia sp.]|nr:hypothetical protein [Puia sp.]